MTPSPSDPRPTMHVHARTLSNKSPFKKWKQNSILTHTMLETEDKRRRGLTLCFPPHSSGRQSPQVCPTRATDTRVCSLTARTHGSARTRAHTSVHGQALPPSGAASSPPGRPRPWKHPSGLSQRHPCLRTESRSCPPPRKSTSNGHRPGFPQNQTT